MKRTNLNSGFLVMALALVPCIAAAGSPAKIVIGQRTVDFGTVSQGEKLELEFAIANEGGEPLTLQMRPTCGCTLVDYPESIAAGDTGKVKATVDTSDLQGPIDKSILVVSNDPETPSLRLAARAVVQPVFMVLPKPLVRMSVIQGQSASAKVTLQAADPSKNTFKVTSVEPESPHVTATAHPVAAGADGPARYEIDLEVGPDAPLGFLNVPVVIHTDHPTAKTVRVNVVGTVRRPLQEPRQG